MSGLRDSESQRLAGGELCLDFANTVNGHRRLTPHEYLKDYRDLVLWGRHAGALISYEADKLMKMARMDQVEAQAVYRLGLNLRETIFNIYSALAGGKEAEPGDLEELSAVWREHAGHTRLIKSARGYEIGWDKERALEIPLPRRDGVSHAVADISGSSPSATVRRRRMRLAIRGRQPESFTEMVFNGRVREPGKDETKEVKVKSGRK